MDNGRIDLRDAGQVSRYPQFGCSPLDPSLRSGRQWGRFGMTAEKKNGGAAAPPFSHTSDRARITIEYLLRG